MKLYFHATIVLLIIITNVSAQILPTNLICLADNLNFREQPDTTSSIIGQIQNGEFLELIEVVVEDEDYFVNHFNLELSWLKVKREHTDQKGYVFGKYVGFGNTAFLRYQDCHRIQKGNWYGIKGIGDQYLIEEVQPSISTSGEGYKSISVDSNQYEIIVCDQNLIKTGNRKRFLFKERIPVYVKEGESKSEYEVWRNNDFKFRIACSWTKNEKGHSIFSLEFIKTDLESGETWIQDLTKDIIAYSHFGLLGALDINLDGTPELFLHEADNRTGTLYYFKSIGGKLELQSVTWGYSKC